MKPRPSRIDASAQPTNGASVCHMYRYRSVASSSVAAPSRNEKRRPRVSAITPVGISNKTWPAEKNAFAAKASAFDRPASSRNSVLTPQMNDAANVVRSVSVR